jgi:hypothetical protein
MRRHKVAGQRRERNKKNKTRELPAQVAYHQRTGAYVDRLIRIQEQYQAVNKGEGTSSLLQKTDGGKE